MSGETNDVSIALKLIPIPWLYMPGIALSAKAGTPAPKIGPLAAAAIGVAVGGGLQLAGQALRKSRPEDEAKLIGGVQCTLTFKELEDVANRVMREQQSAKGGLAEIANAPPDGAKPFPIATAAFLAGVAAGAAAARP